MTDVEHDGYPAFGSGRNGTSNAALWWLGGLGWTALLIGAAVAAQPDGSLALLIAGFVMIVAWLAVLAVSWEIKHHVRPTASEPADTDSGATTEMLE